MEHLKSFINTNNIKNANLLAEKLMEEFSICCRKELDAYGDMKYTFKYNQINSPKGHPTVDECRGVVLDEHLNLVFKGFNRFYNMGEMTAVTEQFDWSNPVTAYEKADGSLVKLYHHNGLWQVGTSGTATAEVPFNSTDWDAKNNNTFRQKILSALGYYSEEDFQNNAGSAFLKDTNYVFEFISPENRIVTPYELPEMVLLAAFRDGIELSNEELRFEFDDMHYDALNVRLPKKHTVTSKEELVELMSSLQGLEEGFVLRDSKGMRIKVKTPIYVTAHHMRGEMGLTVRSACKLVLANEQDEYLSYFPESSDKIQLVVDTFNDYLQKTVDIFKEIKHITDQRAFAEEAKKHSFSGLLFTLRKGLTVKEAYYSMLTSKQISTLENLVNDNYD